MTTNAPPLRLGHDLVFADLYARDGLQRLDRLFIETLRETDPALASRLLAARESPDALARKGESELLIALAPHVEDFLASLFDIATQVRRRRCRGKR